VIRTSDQCEDFALLGQKRVAKLSTKNCAFEDNGWLGSFYGA